MSLLVCVVILLSLPLVGADFWDDFSNNLATDLAPLLSLFGERVTMQYLSESITFLDYFIFAMAPMGILTALVSAIRVCGSPSLRAFVGRAQEGAGNAEAELCSSTSRNVCELYNNGGITRVFGRPKILEIIHDTSDPDFSTTAGIYPFQDYIKTSHGKALWKEVGARTDMESQSEDIDGGSFAPNLSLNIGIKRKSETIFWGVAVFGAVLQVGVLVYAGIITYYLQWESDDSSSVEYACPLTVLGTVLVYSGVFYCAYLVGESTNEQVYCRSSSTDNSTPQNGTEKPVPALYWLQPGGQVLGDQTFDAFGYSDRDQPLQKYLISWKRRSEEQKRRIWEAVIMTTIGFVMQFIGLRGIHPTASIAQLGAIIVMSAARASLRMQRLKSRDNFLVDCPDEVVGYELDWLALCIGREDIQNESKQMRQKVPHNLNEDKRDFWEFCGTSRTIINDEASFYYQGLNVAAKLLSYRRRLAELTESTSFELNQANPTRQFRDDMVKVKSVAKQLARAIESATSLISTGSSVFELGANDSLWWEIDCSVATRLKPNKHQNDPSSQGTFPVRIQLKQSYDSRRSWKLDVPLEIEAIMGLWVWSLVSDFTVETENKYNHARVSRAFEVPIRCILSTSEDCQDLQLWFPTRSFPTRRENVDCKDAPFTRTANVFTLRQEESDRLDFLVSDPFNRHSKFVFSDLFNTYQPLVSDLPQDIGSNNRPQVVRYFGWHNIETHQQMGDVESGSYRLTLTTTSAESLVSCCAQEMFGSFIKGLLSHVSNVGRISVEEGPQGLYLSNALLNDLIGIFVSSGLGLKEGALACVLPAMLSKLRIPPIEVAFQIAMATLKKHSESKHQLEEYLESAGDLLRWAWGICKQPPREGEVRLKDYACLCAMSLGELSRLAITDGIIKFAEKKIRWLRHEIHDQSEGCCESFERYAIILARHGRKNTGGQSRRVGDTPTLIPSLLSLTQSSTGMTRAQEGTDICRAASLGWAEVVLASLTSGADPDLPDEAPGSETPLCHAVKNKHANVVDILIGWGASQYCRSSDGLSPLDLAVQNGHHVIVKSLLHTFDPTLVSDCRGTNIRGKTTLHIAAEHEDEGIVKLLIDSGKFDFESRDDDGNTPLHIAADRLAEAPVEAPIEAHLEASVEAPVEAPVELLVDSYESKIEIEKDDSRSPLDMAIHKGQEATLKMFFDVYKVDPESRDSRKSTPLHKAVRHGQEAIIKLLLDTYNVDRESRDDKGLTPLHWATKRCDGRIARLLIDTYNVNTNVRDDDLTTPLEYAIHVENLDLVEFMVNVTSEESRAKALLLAKKEGYGKIIDLLTKKAEQLRDIESN